MTDTPQILVEDFDSLIVALRARKAAVGMSDAELDFRTGLTDRYCGKILVGAKTPNARFIMSMIQGLGYDVVLVKNDAHLGEFTQRDGAHVRDNHQKRKLRRIMRELGAKGLESMRARGTLASVVQEAGRARQKQMTKAARRNLARASSACTMAPTRARCMSDAELYEAVCAQRALVADDQTCPLLGPSTWSIDDEIAVALLERKRATLH